jgi:phosphoenolpyruvate---glycerone phosphotransferase subunit DhaL
MTLIDCIRHTTQTLIDHVEELTTLDAAIGDGDHGLNMKRGSLAIQGKLDSLQGQPMEAVLKTLGMTCMSMVGGSSGPVFGTLLVTLSKELPGASTPADASAAIQAGMAALTRLGKAEVGQKTLLDVLDPVRRLLADMPADLPRAEQLAQLKTCALDAAEATRDLVAVKGRASFLGERAHGHIDPGSRSMALIIAAVCDHFPSTQRLP